jgi:hypothetical protein
MKLQLNPLQMKTNKFKLFAVAVMSVICTTSTYGQGLLKPFQKLENEQMIPEMVSQNFVNEHPNAVNAEWRGYPKPSVSSEWYEYNPTKQSSKPTAYYVAKFSAQQSDFNAIYDANGNKIAIHRLFVAGLPEAVLEAVSKGAYRNWSLALEKEEIYRNDLLGATKVYRIKMSKEYLQHYLFYSEDGALLMDKTIQ